MAEMKTVDINSSSNSFDISKDTPSMISGMKDLLDVLEEVDKKMNDSYDKQVERIINLYKKSGQNAEQIYKMQIAHSQQLYQKQVKEMHDQIEAKYKEEVELLIKLDKKEQELRKKALEKRKKDEIKQLEELAKAEAAAREKQAEEDRKNAKKQLRDDLHRQASTAFSLNASGQARKEAWQEMLTRRENESNKEMMERLSEQLTSGLADLALSLKTTIDRVGLTQSKIDTRLQGSKKSRLMGSYWTAMDWKVQGAAGISPFIKQETLVNQIENMVSQGIAFNVEQRATLATMSEKIASTFNATHATLLRLVRIQQEDTTAARLGMESALNSFLNNMYETSEYLKGVSESVKSSLEDAMSLMTGENALSFEYQVQKWLGSMYSVGMSQGSVNSLSTALGQIASGKIEALTNGGSGNLIVMAASNAGLDLGSILKNGLNDSTTNSLLDAAVGYLGNIYNQTKENKVVQQQMASVFGMTAADLKSISNLMKSRTNISENGLTYATAMGQLKAMANSMDSRVSMGEKLSNMWSNVQYGMGAGIASNPALYAIYKMGSLLKQTTGGIDIPLPLVMGSGLNYKLNVADLMLVGAMSGGVMSALAKTLVGLTGGVGAGGTGILKRMGVDFSGSSDYVVRGTGSNLITKNSSNGFDTSNSGYGAQGDGEGIKDSILTSETDKANKTTADAVDSSDEIQLKDVNTSILDILDVLRSVLSGSGSRSISVSIDSSSGFGYYGRGGM